jgi:hypothetical protein
MAKHQQVEVAEEDLQVEEAEEERRSLPKQKRSVSPSAWRMKTMRMGA